MLFAFPFGEGGPLAVDEVTVIKVTFKNLNPYISLREITTSP